MWLFIGLLLVFGLAIAALYNNLLTRKNQVAFAQSSVDALLKKRYDLVPNLTETVKGYAAHEASIFNTLADTRARLVRQTLRNPNMTGTRLEHEAKLGQLLTQVLAVAEAYPDLKANQNFLQLQHALFELEEQIAAARRFFNAAVNDYNNTVQTFPSNLIANAINYRPLPYYSVPPLERRVPSSGKL